MRARNTQKKGRALESTADQKRKTVAAAFYPPAGTEVNLQSTGAVIPAKGWPGYLCAQGQIVNGHTRRGDQLVYFTRAIHKVARNVTGLRAGIPPRVMFTVARGRSFARLVIEASAEELRAACDQAITARHSLREERC